jgi:hypothetical protein
MYDMKISSSKAKTIGSCGKNVQRVKTEIEGKLIEQVSNFNYLGNVISHEEKDISAELQRYNKMNGITKCHFGEHITYKIMTASTSKASLCYDSKNWVINKGDGQKLEAAQMRFLRPLIGLTRLDCQRNPDICNRLSHQHCR